MRIIDPLSMETFAQACHVLSIAPQAAVTDPTRCLRIAGSVPVEIGQRFADLVCQRGTAPDLGRMSPDESALATALLWIKVTDQMRRQLRAVRRAEAVLAE